RLFGDLVIGTDDGISSQRCARQPLHALLISPKDPMHEAPRESRARIDLLAEDSVITSAGEEVADPLRIGADTPGRQTGEKMRDLFVDLNSVAAVCIPHGAPFRER